MHELEKYYIIEIQKLKLNHFLKLTQTLFIFVGTSEHHELGER